jgi:hypothetical protein
VPTPTRLPPRVGSRVRITHFGGETEIATVAAIWDDGRSLLVAAADGEAEFVLSAATAKFVASGVADGARLQLLD